MANSVVKVTDSMLNDNLLLLVGEDGTVTPDRETVQTYLNSKSGSTNIQLMHINKNDGKGIDVSIDNLMYMPDGDIGDVTIKNRGPPPELNMEEVARNLYNIRLDHDYTPLTSPKSSPKPTEEDDLVKTLSILEGTVDLETKEVEPVKEPKVEAPVVDTVKQDETLPEKETIDSEENAQLTPVSKRKARSVSVSKPTRAKVKAKKVEKEEEEEDEEVDEEEEDEDEDMEFEDDDNDSDFELEEDLKPKTVSRRVSRTRSKSESKPPKSPKSTPKKELKLDIKAAGKTDSKDLKEVKEAKEKEEVKTPETKAPETPTDKKPVKKEKKTPKPMPDDFALFSTPDIIRRVGGKETTQDTSPSKPAKITNENRSKSSSERAHSPTKHNRLSVDAKHPEAKPHKKDRRPSTEKSKRTSIDEKPKHHHRTKSTEQMDVSSLESLATPLLMNDETGANVGVDFNAGDQNNLGLDLDQTLLDNLNADLISEDILYQVAQSLVSNTDLQNVIDKGINEGKLVLDPNLQQSMAIDTPNVVQNTTPQIQESHHIDTSTKGGTQIVRSDGRVVTIPPIERPTTRSRNKRKDDEKSSLFKPTHKPLDDEHVSGNELDSSGDEEEESEDDPNKLWCICNQPHNNRFMICCDTCEEWYHGKCVNITKAMGQQMESEGKEWICLFCKDPSLRRPHAAARRVRKASRNSRASTDSLDTPKKSDTPGSVPCVVCQKPARKNSIFCSEACILVQAQTVERTVVFERSTGHMLTGNKAPSAANLDQWLKDHPTYEAVKAGGKVVTSKTGNLTQSKLKLVKNPESEGGVSLAIQNKGVNIGVLKHVPKPVVNVKTPTKLSQFKIVSKHVPANQANQQQVKTLKVLPPSSKINIISNTTITPSKAKVINTPVKTVKPSVPAPKDKPMPAKTPKIRQQEQQAPQATKQENIRENVQKTLFEQLTNRLKLAEDLKLTEDEVRSISTEIESQLYKCFGDTGQKYRNKYRSLIFNIKDVKNQTLWRRICEKSINPYELVRLSPDDLASQELAMWREREAKHQLDMIKKSELELLNCNRQYVMKTHKGEQVLEEERRTDIIDNTEVIKSLTEGSTLDGGDTKAEKEKDKDKKNLTSKHSHKDKERKSSREKDHHRRRSSSRDKDKDKSRRRSRSRDHASRKDKKRSRSRDREKHRKSHKSSKYKKEGPIETSKLDPKSKEILDKLVVNKIVPPLEDRLWRHVPQEDIVPAVESDSDHEPSSTVTIPTPPRSSEPDDFQASNNQSSNDKPSADKDQISEDVVKSPPPKQQPAEIWRGSISMIDVAQISISAHEVSGDCAGLGKELHSNLEIVGRISPDTVWDYITKMKCSNSKTISLVRLTATNMEEKMPYLALYSYLSSRTRLGVVKSTNKAVKDFYILPLAPTKPIPQALLPINGPGFGESRPALLLGIIVRDKRKRPYGEPIMNPLPMIKKSRVETPPLPVPPPPPPALAAAAAASPATRSYTPPPVKDPRLNKLALPKVPPPANEEDEPYSPEDSDPDSSIVPPIDTSVPPPSIAPFQTGKYPKTTIPGLVSPPLPSSTHDLQRQMEELNKKIEMQKSEINSISQNIVTASGSEIGTSALANIALPSNLQQILDSIKTIEAATPTPDTPETPVTEVPTATSAPTPSTSDLTIPLMIPKTFSKRMVTPPQPPSIDLTSDTIPLNLPTKPKIKPLSVNSPILDLDKAGSSVLASLSEEDLVKKAAEMLGDSDESKNKRSTNSTASPQTKRTKIDLTLPPVPGLDDDDLM